MESALRLRDMIAVEMTVEFIREILVRLVDQVIALPLAISLIVMLVGDSATTS